MIGFPYKDWAALEPLLQHRNKPKGGNWSLFCIQLFHCVYIQEMLVVLLQTLTDNMASNTPLLHFQIVT